MQIAASTPLQSLFGYGAGGAIRPVTPAAQAPAARFGRSWSAEDQAFGAALIREVRRPREPALYGPDARLHDADRGEGASDEAEAAEDRTLQALQQRDRTVRRKEEDNGESVGGRHFLYQIGPDGQNYAVGSAAHVVRKDKTEGSTEEKSVSGALGASDQELLRRLGARDAMVRGHESAHIMAAGPQARGPAEYTYQTGPDGNRYAVSGSVDIAVQSSPASEEDAARQAARAERAATAPGEVSLADTQVAMRARQLTARNRGRALEVYADQAAFTPA